ncbi:hypothetical protein [Pseudonocardia broussonetiae]|uniref:Uncharacterized protein n=1 Tax=Pseudonocardia broussonetiae TaxID=2736640 RepID=A0A6M6JL74_9PSEU|nr:hypothetical protein [Pseudonocardia broussonetiae]QJY47943.1 hypothetical protein HOP40_20855 [Pseudonocardia broussonetiae]
MTHAGYAQRRRAELGHARDSLRAEWAYWQAATAPGEDLEKHNTQIGSVVRLLGAGMDGLDTTRPGDPAEAILDLHHVWDFYRAKLALRSVAPVRRFLDAADELAWTTYRPAIEAAGLFGVRLREPPLVFLDRSAVPFATPRGESYRDLLPRDVRTRTGADVARSLPFPVIGLPWYLSSHLPGALLVAHEVGHHIEDDCGLTPELTARLVASAVPESRKAQWKVWLGEAFADVVASLACGPAYLTVMLDGLAAAPEGGAGQERYPPAVVRAALCRATVDRRARWDGRDTADEAAAVVSALLAGPYDGLGKRALPEVVKSPSPNTDRGAERLRLGLSSGLHDVRSVLAAAARAFVDDPAAYDAKGVGPRAITEVLALRPKGVRGMQLGDRTSREKRDTAFGQWFVEILER